MQPTTPTDRRLAGALALVFAALYVATLCPTVFRGDSGEITTAIWSGGVIHPPGYPLFTLLGRLFLVLVPFGEPAYRIGVLVALCGALALAFLFRLMRELEVPQLAALGAAALFGVSLTFWSQCNRVEVYSLHMMLALLALWQCIRYRKSGEERALYTACAAIGLGFAHHLTIVLLVPGLLVLCGARLWKVAGLGRRLLGGLGLLLLTGPPLYLLLILWSRSAGYSCLGAPTNLAQLWDHVSGKSYQGYLSLPNSADSLSTALQPLKAIISENFFAPLSVLVVLGALALARRAAAVLVGLLLTALTVLGFALSYSIIDIAPYYLVPFVLGAVLVGVALGQVQSALIARERPLLFQAIACFFLPLGYLVTHFTACDLHAVRGVEQLAEQKLRACPKDAVLLSIGDEDTHSLLYVQAIKKIRPDVALISESVLKVTFFEPSHHYLRWLECNQVPLLDANTTNDPTLQDDFLTDGYLIRLLEGPLKDRPLRGTFFGIPEEDQRHLGHSPYLDWVKEHYAIYPEGVVFAFWPRAGAPSPTSAAAACKRAWDTIDLPTLPMAPTATEVDGNYTARHYAIMLCNYASLCEQNGQPEQARQIYLVALNWCQELTVPLLKGMATRSPVIAEMLSRIKA